MFLKIIIIIICQTQPFDRYIFILYTIQWERAYISKYSQSTAVSDDSQSGVRRPSKPTKILSKLIRSKQNYVKPAQSSPTLSSFSSHFPYVRNTCAHQASLISRPKFFTLTHARLFPSIYTHGRWPSVVEKKIRRFAVGRSLSRRGDPISWSLKN